MNYTNMNANTKNFSLGDEQCCKAAETFQQPV